MPTASEDAFLGPSAEHIPGLAALYDSFAHAIDPFAPERDRAEQAFELEVASWYDSLNGPKPSLHEFRKGVIDRCKKHLKATRKPSTI
jgi:hypothetical protein